jgi:hypothetical protein
MTYKTLPQNKTKPRRRNRTSQRGGDFHRATKRHGVIPAILLKKTHSLAQKQTNNKQ